MKFTNYVTFYVWSESKEIDLKSDGFTSEINNVKTKIADDSKTIINDEFHKKSLLDDNQNMLYEVTVTDPILDDILDSRNFDSKYDNVNEYTNLLKDLMGQF